MQVNHWKMSLYARSYHKLTLRTRRGGTEKHWGLRLSKRSATIGWRGAAKKIFGFTNPPDGRKRHFPSVLSSMCIGPIKNMFNTHFEILPAVHTSWSTWQILGWLSPPTFFTIPFFLEKLMKIVSCVLRFSAIVDSDRCPSIQWAKVGR